MNCLVRVRCYLAGRGQNCFLPNKYAIILVLRRAQVVAEKQFSARAEVQAIQDCQHFYSDT